jgi:hypothetical protein
MTPSSVTQFITITFPISCPFELDGAIQMRHLVIAETGLFRPLALVAHPGSLRPGPIHPSAWKVYSRNFGFTEL